MNENYYLKKLKITRNYINASNDEKKNEKIDEENATSRKITYVFNNIFDNH